MHLLRIYPQILVEKRFYSTRKTHPARWLWVGSVLHEDTYFDSLIHTHAGLQQQQGAVVMLGVIVIADLLYRVPARLA
jgi:hypothetical protein